MSSSNAEIAKTEEEAKRLGYKKLDPNSSTFSAHMLSAVINPCAALTQGQLCSQSNCRPDGTMIVCYCNGMSCDNCYTRSC